MGKAWKTGKRQPQRSAAGFFVPLDKSDFRDDHGEFDEGAWADTNAEYAMSIREAVSEWLADLGHDPTAWEVRLHEFQPNEIRLYPN